MKEKISRRWTNKSQWLLVFVCPSCRSRFGLAISKLVAIYYWYKFQALVKNYDQDMDTLTKQQKQQVEKAESSQALDLKTAAKRIKSEQVWDIDSGFVSLATWLQSTVILYVQFWTFPK